MLRDPPYFFPPTQQGGISAIPCKQPTTQSASLQKPLRVRFFETEAQHELSMTPDQSINECTEKETLYQREFYQVGNLL